MEQSARRATSGAQRLAMIGEDAFGHVWGHIPRLGIQRRQGGWPIRWSVPQPATASHCGACSPQLQPHSCDRAGGRPGGLNWRGPQRRRQREPVIVQLVHYDMADDDPLHQMIEVEAVGAQKGERGAGRAGPGGNKPRRRGTECKNKRGEALLPHQADVEGCADAHARMVVLNACMPLHRSAVRAMRTWYVVDQAVDRHQHEREVLIDQKDQPG